MNTLHIVEYLPDAEWREQKALSYEAERWSEEAKKQGQKVQVHRVIDAAEWPKLEAGDGILLRVYWVKNWEKEVVRLGKDSKRQQIWNTPRSIEWAKDKLKTRALLESSGVPQLRAMPVTAQSKIEQVVEALGLPLILKDPHGSYGHGVILAESVRSARSIVDRLLPPWGDVPVLLAEPFIKEAKAQDLRIYVIEGRAVAAMLREAQGDEFRSNAELGGYCKNQALEACPEAVRWAEEAAKALDLQIAGVDLIQTQDGWKVLEVNANPGFRALEKATGVNVAGKVVSAFCLQSKKNPLKYTRKS